MNAVPDTLIESEATVISGINAPAPISITGGEYSIEGGAYGTASGTVSENQAVRIRVRSSSGSAGSATATLTIGGVSGIFRVLTADFDHRVEAEDATLTGGASAATDAAAWNDGAALAGSVNNGVSTSNSMDAEALIIAYRTDTAGVLAVTINGVDAGEFTLQATGGAYATASVVASVEAGDVIALVNETPGAATQTYIDYVEFAASPLRFVSTLVDTGIVRSDGAAVGPDGDIYVSGGPAARNILRVKPNGEKSVFATGFDSSNGSHFDSRGNLYIADYRGNAVRKITPAGVMTTLASSLNGPAGVWVDANDNVLGSLFGANFTGDGATVARITPGGTATTYAQGGGLQDVVGVVGDENGRVFASNWLSGRVYEITGGDVNLLAQTGSHTNQICYSNGHIYLPSPGGARIQRVSVDGVVDTLAGGSAVRHRDGLLDSALFISPNSCAFSPDGTILYVMETDNGFLRKIDAGPP